MVLKSKPLTLALARPDTIIYMVQYNYKVYVHRAKLFLRNYNFFFFWLFYMACKILVPVPGIKPVTLQ